MPGYLTIIDAIEQSIFNNLLLFFVAPIKHSLLSHRVMVNSEAGGIIIPRQFYVGHSYNSNHVVAVGLPYKGAATLVFYLTRSSTDQVAGIGSSLKYLIGCEQMKEEMIKRVQRVNKDLKDMATSLTARVNMTESN